MILAENKQDVVTFGAFLYKLIWLRISGFSSISCKHAHQVSRQHAQQAASAN